MLPPWVPAPRRQKPQQVPVSGRASLHVHVADNANDLPDEMDLASSEYLQSFTFRLRGREKSFLDKITKAVAKIDDGTFGTCEECGEDISIKRLEARPVATLSVEAQERHERMERTHRDERE